MSNDYFKRIDGPTPNGGTYAEIVFYDKDQHRCKESEAYMILINEYNKKGNLLHSTYAFANS